MSRLAMRVGMRKLSGAAAAAAAAGRDGPLAIVFMNMGGPSTVSEVNSYLTCLFSDRDLIPLGPWQGYLAKLIAKRRTAQVSAAYEAIGGGSPIRRWSEVQADALCRLLDKLAPRTAPHRYYIAFRYAEPFTDQTILQMRKDGIRRAIAFSQYPQYSCSTSGSSLNELFVQHQKCDPEDTIRWSFIDRWPAHEGFVDAVVDNIKNCLDTYPEEDRTKVVLLFSAHSLPMSVVNRGDAYPSEVSATVYAVMSKLNFSNPYKLVWQSQVGPSAWLGPQTNDALKGYHRQGFKNIALVPIAFTSDHIETLYELDKEYIAEAQQNGMDGVKRVESLNGNARFVKALADLVCDHLKSPSRLSQQLALQCPGCVSQKCRRMREWAHKHASRI